MLILNHQEVRYCHVIRPRLGKFNKIPGVSYHSRLFYKLESHPKTEHKVTVKRARDYFDRTEQRLLFLVIEEPNAISIWREDSQLVCVQSFEAYLSTKEEIYFAQKSKYIVKQKSDLTVVSKIKNLMSKDLSEVFGV